MKKTIVSLVGAACIISSSNLPSIVKASEVPSVSIKLKNYIGSQTQLTVTVKGEYSIPGSNFSLVEGKTYTVKAANGALSLYENGTLLGSFSNLQTVPKVYGTDNYILINNHPYLGTMNFSIENNTYVRPTNTLPMEDYLKGVVPFEMMASWNREALKAQAVAARTYTVKNQSGNMDDTTNFQAYGGYLWNSNSTAAVDETNSQTLTSNGKPIDALYSASNGGMTESNANVWGGTALSYFPVKQDPYDTKVPWGFTIHKTQINTASLDLANPQNWWNSVSEADASIMASMKNWLAQNGYANKEIKIISVPTFSFTIDRTSGNRVKYTNISIQFFTKDKTTGQFDMENNLIKTNTKTLTKANATNIRAMVGAGTMKSYLVTSFHEDAASYSVNGLGNGHGVGMSQWGAKVMADQQLNYKDILSFYFPGTVLTNAQNTTSPSPAPVSLTPKGVLDTPVYGGAVKGKINVSGWFLDKSGVSKIEVLVDGSPVGTAQYGISRPDVLKVYPDYQNSNSGYQLTLDTAAFSNGQHTLTIRETGTNGNVSTIYSKMDVENLPVAGNMDQPAFGASISGNATVRGWVLDGSGVSLVEVLVDGKTVGTAQYGSDRSDVLRVYPEYQNGNSGYQYTLDTTNLSNGSHTIAIRETGKNGTAAVLNSTKVNVSNLSPIGMIDTPANGSSVKGNVTVRGWFLDQKGVSKVNVLVDGQNVGTAEYGSSRPDVQKVYPEYKNANSGYRFTLNSKSLADGEHTLTVQETGKDGNTKTLDHLKINVMNNPAFGNIDEPASGSAMNGNATVRGWLLDGSGVSKVEVLVDGKPVGTAQYGSDRQDVLNVYPDYQNANSGYQYTLNTTSLSNGPHTLAIRETANNGTATIVNSMKVNVLNLSPIGCLDLPVNGSTMIGKVKVKGWLLDQKGVSTVDVLVDGQKVGTAKYGSSRPDVQNVYPEYKNANSGYEFILDSENLADGVHTLSIQETGMDGKTQTINSIKMNVLNSQTKGIIDEPGAGAAISGDATVRGWFLDGRDVSKIEVLVDNRVMGTAEYGMSRPDVLKVYPEFQNSSSGYQFTLNTRTLQNGQHILAIRETGSTGLVTNLPSRMINVQNLPAIGYIDGPAAGAAINGNATVRGWFLDGSGVASVEVLVDGKSTGLAQYGSARSDVKNVYPEYKEANAGYQYSLDTTKFANGQHTLTVKETGVNGSTETRTCQITINN